MSPRSASPAPVLLRFVNSEGCYVSLVTRRFFRIPAAGLPKPFPRRRLMAARQGDDLVLRLCDDPEAPVWKLERLVAELPRLQAV